MTSAITVTPAFDFAGLQFTRSKTGHVQSMWWSYDWKRYNPSGPYQIGSHFHGLRAQSIAAFASTLGVPENEVLVSVRDNPHDGQLEWRCGSAHPVPLLKVKAPRLMETAERMREIETLVRQVEQPKLKPAQDAIDI